VVVNTLIVLLIVVVVIVIIIIIIIIIISIETVPVVTAGEAENAPCIRNKNSWCLFCIVIIFLE